MGVAGPVAVWNLRSNVTSVLAGHTKRLGDYRHQSRPTVVDEPHWTIPPEDEVWPWPIYAPRDMTISRLIAVKETVSVSGLRRPMSALAHLLQAVFENKTNVDILGPLADEAFALFYSAMLICWEESVTGPVDPAWGLPGLEKYLSAFTKISEEICGFAEQRAMAPAHRHLWTRRKDFETVRDYHAKLKAVVDEFRVESNVRYRERDRKSLYALLHAQQDRDLNTVESSSSD
ncbi:hypothetical protein AAF712_004932 [Marasmius tenuissimus]|uniref:Retrotransposon gag domain-containing protein n=1 Tax=Marasmius tenuissimus TaxID=585030 RepID=A0ABR3A3T4_9AGAR|nr:hypothetical protein PM082_014123 [Marasmius tenuissimus]